MRIHVDTSDVRRAIARLQNYSEEKVAGVKRVIVETAAQIESNAVTLAPVDQGNLKNSMFMAISNNGFTADVSNTAEYAAHVEFGTKPHKIKAKNAKMLAFKGSNGNMVFAKEVNHPGTRAQPFLLPAFEQEKAEYQRRLEQELRNV